MLNSRVFVALLSFGGAGVACAAGAPASPVGDTGSPDAGMLVDASTTGTVSAWRSIGPPGGDRFLVAIDPFDAERMMVVGHGAVHKSVDRGDSWQITHDFEMRGSMLSIAFDPTTKDRAVVGAKNGVFLTRDFGSTWVQISSTLPAGALGAQPASLAITPSGRAFVSVDRSTEHAIWETDNLGLEWRASVGVPAGGVALLVRSGEHLFATSSEHGPFRYDGEQWQSIAGQLPAEALAATTVAVDPTHVERMVLGTKAHGVWRTADGGARWERVILGELENVSAGSQTANPSYPLIYDLAIDPVNPRLMFALLHSAGSSNEQPFFQPTSAQTDRGGVMVTADAGATWRRATSGYGGGFRLTIDGSESIEENGVARAKFYWLTSGGAANVLRYDAAAGAMCIANDGVATVFVNALRERAGTLYAAGEQGITYSSDQGAHWIFREPAPSLVYTWDFAFLEHAPNLLLWATGEPAWGQAASKGVWVSDVEACSEGLRTCSNERAPDACAKRNILPDTGVWRLVTRGDRVFALTQDAGILAADLGRDALASADSASWSDLSQGLDEPSVTTLLVDANGEPWMAGTRACSGAPFVTGCGWVPSARERGGVYFRDGSAWVHATGVDAAVSDLAFDAAADVAYAATSRGAFISVDHGRTWSESNEGLGSTDVERIARAVVVDVARSGVAYLGTMGGVARSVNRGTTWSSVDERLMNRFVDRLILVRGERQSGASTTSVPDRLYAATLGGSVFVAEMR